MADRRKGTKTIRKKEEALGKKSGREMTRRERREDDGIIYK
jgi:hypothetical protein